VTFPKLLLSAFAFFCIVQIAQSVAKYASAVPVFADGQQAVTPQTTGTPTVDALATAGASSAATSGAVGTQQAATQTMAIIGTSAARTATADTWTATAAADAATLRAAEQTETGLRVALLVGTLTAIPPMQTQTEQAAWATAAAEQTQAIMRATLDAREATQAAVVDDAAYIATVGSVLGIPTALIFGIFAAAGALTWRIKGESGGKAQASVVAATGREPIPTTTGGQPAAPLDPHTRTERLALRVLGRMARLSREDSATLTSAPDFGDNRSRDKVTAALCAAGLAESVNGVGVQLLDDWTIGELAEAIAGGSITLDDPPTPANVG